MPVDVLYEDGIFLRTDTSDKSKRFSKTFRFEDIDYFSVSEEDRQNIYGYLCKILNSIDDSVTLKTTINNHIMDRLAFESNILIPYMGDGLDTMRTEYNDMLKANVANVSGIMQDKYFTVTVTKNDVEEARTVFQRIYKELQRQLTHVSSNVYPLDANERLKIIHDFFRPGEEMYFAFDIHRAMRRGHSFKDYVLPDGIEIHPDHLRIGNAYARVLYMREYATYIKDESIRNLCDMNRRLMLSMDMVFVPKPEAVRLSQNILTGLQTNAVNFTRKQRRNNSEADIPFEMQQQIGDSTEMLRLVTDEDQRMIFAVITIVHMADTKEQLDSDTETILSCVRGDDGQMGTMLFRQINGMNTVLPYGVRRVFDVRTMTTASAAMHVPFRAKEIMDKNGIYYGRNALSNSMILMDRKRSLNGNGFIFGVPGSGKSFAAKREIANLVLATDDDILIIDPESEYGMLVEKLHGSVIHMSTGGAHYVNLFDFNENYFDRDTELNKPLSLKNDFILSFCAQVMDNKINASQRSIIDHCVSKVYEEFIRNGYKGEPPTLVQFYEELNKQPHPEAREIALALQLYVTGSQDIFAKPTNVNMDDRLICFDIRNLGDNLKTLGMLVVLDAIFNRVTRNRAQGKRTWIYIDEAHLLFNNRYCRSVLQSLWKRVRKYGALCTAITQNVTDVLRDDDTVSMFSNSEFSVILNQFGPDREMLANLLHLSGTQIEGITNAPCGSGLLRTGPHIASFTDEFPQNTELYRAMTTKPGERT